MSEKSFRLRRIKSRSKELKENSQDLKEKFWSNYKKQIENDNNIVIDFIKFENEVKQLEYQIYCCEYEDRRRY